MTKTKTTTHAAKKEEHKEPTKTIHDVLEEIKAEILKLESSSSHGDFRQACRDCAALLDKYMGTP